jgi:hypothetical protein
MGGNYTLKVLFKPPPWSRTFLIRWEVLLPFFKRSWQFKDDRILRPIYRESWFFTDEKGERRFIVGKAWYSKFDDALFFNNGVHRTSVLASQIPAVPTSLTHSVYGHSVMGKAVVRELCRNEKIEIPDLPILGIEDVLSTDKQWVP